MKTTVKIIALAFFMVGLSQVAFAQKTATANANAEILADLSITLDPTENAINFGKISRTTPGQIILSATNDASNQNTGSITNVARFNLLGDNAIGTSVTVAYDASVVMNSLGNNMTMTPSVFGAGVGTNRASATAVGSGTSVTLNAGQYFLWIGGSIPTLNNQATGIYTGTFNINVEYN